MSTQELLAVAAVTVAALFILVWFRRLATTTPEPPEEARCRACEVEKKRGGLLPTSWHDCHLNRGVDS